MPTWRVIHGETKATGELFYVMTIIIAPNHNGSARTRGVPMVRSRTSRGGGVGREGKGQTGDRTRDYPTTLPLSYPAGLWRNHQLQRWVGSGWGSENIWSTFVLGTLEAGKHDVNNSIGEKLSPGEHSTAQRSTRDLPNRFSVRGRLQFRIPT